MSILSFQKVKNSIATCCYLNIGSTVLCVVASTTALAGNTNVFS